MAWKTHYRAAHLAPKCQLLASGSTAQHQGATHTVATDNTLPQGLVGLIVLYVLCMIGLVLTKTVPGGLPSVAWISLVGILATLPWTPGSAWVVEKVSHVNFLTLATPCLAYAGIAIARREIEIAKTSGWKIFIVAVLVMTGTYVGSAFVAQLFL